MRVISAALALLFLIAALLQGNDPDPYYWVLVYGGAAVVAFGDVLGKRSYFWTVLVMGAAAAGMLIALPGVFEWLGSGDLTSVGGPMLETKPWVEPARECLGLFIVFATLAVYARRGSVGVTD